MAQEIRVRASTLTQYDDLDRFSGDYFFPLLNVYVVAKQLMILADARAGVTEFRRDPAFFTARDLYPAASDAVSHLQSLGPLYRRRTGRSKHPGDCSLDDKGVVRTSLDAVRHFVRTVV